MLILNTRSSSNIPIITNGQGFEDHDFTFEFETDTQVYRSCSVTWRNEHFIFGGNTKTTQISQIIDCKLKRIGNLDFSHKYGACANVDDQRIYLCFNNKAGDYKKCRFSKSPIGEFKETLSSAFDHRETRIAASKGKLINILFSSNFR